MRQLLVCLRSPWLYFSIIIGVAYARGLDLDVMEVDAAQYASIAMEMLQEGHWLEVKHRGADYLDKPPLLFWTAALSFSLFGLSNWAYKLPSVLAALLGIWSVYRFTRLYYARDTALFAAFIFSTSLGLVLMCNDVRTDTLLLGFTACAVWQLAAYIDRRQWKYLFGGSVCVGLAMLSKGPIGLIAPAFAAGGHLLWRREWRRLLRWEWLAGLLVVALLLAPMCWGLWQQFDLHPEKWVNGRQGVSGVRFFFWEQSFGRITGENVWKNDASVFFFLHVYLWAFAPWSLLLPWALFKIGGAFRTAPNKDFWPEYYALFGFLLTIIALSFSQYKLPHYIFITLPWASVLVASVMERCGVDLLARRLLDAETGGCLLLGAIVCGWAFPNAPLWIWGVLLTGAFAWFILLWRHKGALSARFLVLQGVATASITAVVLNFHFYPQLLSYQYAKHAVSSAREAGIPPDGLYFFRMNHHTTDFFNGRIIPRVEEPQELIRRVTSSSLPTVGVLCSAENKTTLERAGIPVEPIATLKHFHVAMLNALFLNPKTRSQALETYYLLQLRLEK